MTKEFSLPEMAQSCEYGVSHAYVQYPPFRCDIPGALGVTYDDGSKLLIVPTSGKVYSWPVNSSNLQKEPEITVINERPVVGVRFSLDSKILAVQRSDKEVEFINRESCTSFKQTCKSGTERILGLFWTDCPNYDIVFVTTSGLELYALFLGRNRLKLVETKRQDVNWYVYTHESRLVLLASGMQCKTLSGYQFSAGGVVRLPKFDARMAKMESNKKPVLSSENVHIATMYGRLFCLQLDRVAMLLHVYRFYRDAVVSQGSLPTYAPNVAVSVVDNVLLIHQIDAKVVLLYDILSDAKVPISAPLPLLLRKPVTGTRLKAESSLLRSEYALYSEGWVFLNPDIILDHAHGLLWKIHLDLQAIAASSSDVPSILAFLQRRRHECVKAKQLSITVLRSVIVEKRPLPVISAALDVLTSACSHASKLSTRPTGGYVIPYQPAFLPVPVVPVQIVQSPGIQAGALSSSYRLASAAAAAASEISDSLSNSEQAMSDGEDEVSASGAVASGSNGSIWPCDGFDSHHHNGHGHGHGHHDGHHHGSCPVISPDEMYREVLAVVEGQMCVETNYLVAVILQYLRSAAAEKLKVPCEMHLLLVEMLLREKCFDRIHELVSDKVVEASVGLGMRLVEGGMKKVGMEMLRVLHAHKEYVMLLVEEGRCVEAMRYVRQHSVAGIDGAVFVESAANNPQLLSSVQRFCTVDSAI